MSSVGLAPQRVTRPTLIAPGLRVGALVTVLVGLAGFTALGLSVAGTDTETGFDTTVDGWLFRNVGVGAANVMLGFSEPKLTTSILVLVALAAALARRWVVLAWAVIAPTLAIVLSEIVLKPVIGRRLVVDLRQDPHYATHLPPGGALVTAHGYAYPSGHETGVTAMTVELAVLVLLLPMGRRLRAALLVVLALWTLIAAAGLVCAHYHFATDTVGAILLTSACVIAVALATDLVVGRWRRRPQFT